VLLAGVLVLCERARVPLLEGCCDPGAPRAPGIAGMDEDGACRRGEDVCFYVRYFGREGGGLRHGARGEDFIIERDEDRYRVVHNTFKELIKRESNLEPLSRVRLSQRKTDGSPPYVNNHSDSSSGSSHRSPQNTIAWSCVFYLIFSVDRKL
jgi:hypothetical protein